MNSVDCGTSVDPNGVLEGDSFFAGLAKITCNTGYTGGGKITCQDTAVWDMSAATACALVGKYDLSKIPRRCFSK